MLKTDLHHASSGFSFPFLDGLRGLAILGVVLFHLPHPSTQSLAGRIVTGSMFAGYAGVALFFVISGFLISLAVFAIETKKDLVRYFLRRAGKILPPFYLTLLLFGLMYYAWDYELKVLLRAVAFYVTTYTNFNPKYLWYDPPCWTLFIEIHFYLLLPAVYLLLRRWTQHAAIITWLLFFTIPALVRFGTTYLYPQSYEASSPAYDMFPRSLDCFSFGILAALLFKADGAGENMKKLAVPLSYLGLAALVGSCTLAAYFRIVNDNLAETNFTTQFSIEGNRYLSGTASGLLMFMAFYTRGVLISLFSFAPLRYIGLISYEWFLLHYPIIVIFNKYHSDNSNVWIGLTYRCGGVIVSFALAAAMYHFFSAPILHRVKAYAQTIR